MKFASNCEKLTGTFGGVYYELTIKVSLDDKELNAARQYKKYNASLVGARYSEQEGALLEHFTSFSSVIKGEPKTSLSIKDLTEGVKLKARNDNELSTLLEFEVLVKERCKQLKEYLEEQQEASGLFGQKGGASYEEDL
jgi:hypothetical protein